MDSNYEHNPTKTYPIRPLLPQFSKVIAMRSTLSILRISGLNMRWRPVVKLHSGAVQKLPS